MVSSKLFVVNGDGYIAFQFQVFVVSFIIDLFLGKFSPFKLFLQFCYSSFSVEGIFVCPAGCIGNDKAGANAAARFWWLLKATGHENIQVLDGGLKNAIEAGLPVTNVIPEITPLPAYPADNWILPTVDADKVAKAVADPDYLVIDVRESYRYRGESEPIDLIAGHIPGAVNIPYTGNLNAHGNFLSAEELADKYKDAIGDHDPKRVIVHCGSGVTACHTLLAMEEAGIETPNLYVGSWSEWSRNDRPVAVGE